MYIYILIELPWLENLARTCMWHKQHWTTVSALLGLIISAYHDLHQQPKNAEANQ